MLTATRVPPPSSLDAMASRFLLALCLVLLVLGFEAQAAHVPQQDEVTDTPLLSQVQESLLSYWDKAKAAATGLYQNKYLSSMDEKLRDMYSQSTAAVSTYAGIFSDQLYFLLKGEE
ncbi:apolipoprotein C-II [Erinaceus europaeus]|uniref:Apolipoprotein C-II n=1 Tax=Erinaceus europaeus TaxID=9365 RepID=A0A1S3ACH7_ERIEU|nr:apolipoprotein C-II [Erinaceus europaeus]